MIALTAALRQCFSLPFASVSKVRLERYGMITIAAFFLADIKPACCAPSESGIAW